MGIKLDDLNQALEAIEVTRGISKEVILEALQEAMIKGFKKQLGGDDALVRFELNLEKGTIEMAQVKEIVEEVEDDFLQISLEDAKEEEKAKNGFIDGKEFVIPASVEDLKKATAMSIKSMLKQKFSEAEKSILFETFKDKANTMITGKVEKCDERGCAVNIGRLSVYLPRKQMIGDERFAVGEDIRLFVAKVDNGPKGAQILVTRADDGFLKCLFSEEIREIYDGTILIKGVARQAGERSKVAVYSNDPNVDPAGACIGPNGSRIQKIVSQLGNSQVKEKIDVVTYSKSVGLFVMESLKPARVVGIIVDEENKSAVAIVKDDSYSLAIGRLGVNVRLAVKLTGFNIDIKTESDAIEEELTYQTFEELQALELENKSKAILSSRGVTSTSNVDILPGLPEGYVAPQERVYEVEKNDFDETLLAKAEMEDTTSAPVVEESPVEEQQEVPVIEAVKEEKASETVENVQVKTTTTLSDLEKSLEETSSTKKTSYKKNTHKKKVEEESEEVVKKDVDTSSYMSIYTEEELREMEEEELEDDSSYEDDVDYEDYDDYYDDDDK